MSEAAVPRHSSVAGGFARLLSDDNLTRRAIEGDERAFSAIFHRYHQDLYRYCLALLGNPHDAQDALQNTMVKVLRALPGEERRIELKPWLYRIAHNEAIDLRRRRREADRLDPERLVAGTELSARVEQRDRLRRLIGDLDALPERQRGALLMRELSGLGFAEIGTALGTSPAVARQTVYEARLSLRQMEEGREMDCTAVSRALSDADGRVTRRRDIRAHLRGCPSCRAFGESIAGRQRDLAALAPMPALAAAGILHSLLGGGGGAGGGGAGLAGALGGGAAKSLSASAALKATATVAVVAAIGAGAADRGGLVDLGLPGGAGSQSGRSAQEAGEAGAAGGAEEVGDAASGERSGAELSASGRAKKEDGSGNGQGKAASKSAAEGNGVAGAGAKGANGYATAHPHGHGHEKALPSASTRGQQTASAHKASGHRGGRSGGSRRHGAHPPKPAHPAPQPKPIKPAQPSSSAPSEVTSPRGSLEAAGSSGGKTPQP
jgi:RNA polymerase sigma factor (sigma-70 family)